MRRGFVFIGGAWTSIARRPRGMKGRPFRWRSGGPSRCRTGRTFASLGADRFLRVDDNVRQVLVLGDPFCEITSLFRLAQFSDFHHHNLMMRDLAHVFAPQSFGHEAPAFHLEAHIKGTVFEKYART